MRKKWKRAAALGLTAITAISLMACGGGSPYSGISAGAVKG